MSMLQILGYRGLIFSVHRDKSKSVLLICFILSQVRNLQGLNSLGGGLSLCGVDFG